jgi:hypothetical protein
MLLVLSPMLLNCNKHAVRVAGAANRAGCPAAMRFPTRCPTTTAARLRSRNGKDRTRIGKGPRLAAFVVGLAPMPARATGRPEPLKTLPGKRCMQGSRLARRQQLTAPVTLSTVNPRRIQGAPPCEERLMEGGADAIDPIASKTDPRSQVKGTSP